jgi:hypothetical protein
MINYSRLLLVLIVLAAANVTNASGYSLMDENGCPIDYGRDLLYRGWCSNVILPEINGTNNNDSMLDDDDDDGQ